MFFAILLIISNLTALSSFKSAMRFLMQSRISPFPISSNFLCFLSRCSSISVKFETLSFSSPVICESFVYTQKYSHVCVLNYSSRYFFDDIFELLRFEILHLEIGEVLSSIEMSRLFRWVLVIIFSMEFLSLNPPVYLDVKLNHLPPFLKDSILCPFSCSTLYQPMCLKKGSYWSYQPLIDCGCLKLVVELAFHHLSERRWKKSLAYLSKRYRRYLRRF